MFKNILICTDGSPLANKAAKSGILLAKALSAKVTGYSALEDLLPVYSEGYVFDQQTIDRFEDATRTAGQHRVDVIGKLAKDAGVPFTDLVTTSYAPHEGIINAAKSQKCDLIVMGSHGRSGFTKLLMGSVTQNVLTQSKMTVIVYR